MNSSANDINPARTQAKVRSFGAWTGELAKGRERAAQIEHAREHAHPRADEMAAALDELRLTYEELSVAEEELRVQNDELRRAQHFIEVERARYRELFLESPIPYFITTGSGAIRDANRAASILVGRRADLLRGKPLVVFTRDRSRRRIRAAIQRLANGASGIAFHLDIQSRKGVEIRAQATASAVRSLDGSLQEIRWQLVDQRPQLRRERARRRRAQLLESMVNERTEELARTQRLKDQLIATVSHELRTPLAAIGGYSDILTAGLRGALSDSQRNDIERIHHAYEHMARVVDDLLSYTRLTSGQLSFDIRDTDLSAELRSVMELVMPQAGSRDITVRAAEIAGALTVRADPERLRQILLNVLSNAVKFTPPGGTVTIRVAAEDDAAIVEIEDTGRGIPLSQQERIFEPFVRLNADQKTPGVGLGLAISRELARAAGGELTVRSELDAGSCFVLRVLRSTRLASQTPSE